MALVDKNMYLRTDYESFLQKCLLHYGLGLMRVSNNTGVAASSAASSAGAQ